MTRLFLLMTVFLLGAVAPAGAQERGGDDDRGGRRGGFGGAGDFLRRMDANGNGMIDPEEAEGRGGFFLRRMAEINPEIDLSQPVPLEKLEQSMAAARERWELNRSGEGREERRDNGDAGKTSSAVNASHPPERIVPGFGEAADLPVVPGFGLMTKALAMIKVTDADRQEAQRRFGWFDRDNNGVIEGAEMEQARSRDYDQFDTNRDGKLTVDELAMRYAKRRVEEEAAAKAAAASASASSSPSSSTRRDDDRSSRDGGRRSSSSGARTSSTKTGGGKPYRVAAAGERLAKMGLPGWFLDKDDDGDGQIAMAEFGESWTESAVSEFAKFDLNGDGVITPEECLRAAKSGGISLARWSSRGGDFGSRSSSSNAAERAKPAVNTGGEPASSTAAREAESPPAATAASGSAETAMSSEPVPAEESNAAIDPRYLSYAQGRIKQVDTNGDGMLQPDEWIKMSKSPAAADTDGDGKVTPQELAMYYMKQQ